ncbi:MAG: tetratricopeptide repeat protein [Planctomycetota bacterium]|jgi:tetratricopeptide (TPR) repeat protein
MCCDKNTLIVLPALTAAPFLALFGALPCFAASEPAEPSRFDATAQEQVSAFLQKQVSDLIEPVLTDFPEDLFLTRVAVKFYQQSKNPRTVMATLQKGLEHHPQDFGLNNTAAEVAFNNGDYENAIRFGQKALAINPQNPAVHEDLAEAMLFSGHYQQAVACLDTKIALLGGSERSDWLLGKGHMFLKNYDTAKDCYERAYQNNPGSAIIYYSNMAKLYMRLKQPDKAKEYMKRHREITAQIKSRDLEEAKNKADRVILDSTDSEVLVFSRALARLCIRGRTLYRDTQQPDRAQTLFSRSEDIFTEAITIAPEAGALYREYADMYLTTGKKLSEALPLAQQAVGLEASAENYFVLGRAYYRNLDTEKALRALEQGLKLEPTNRAMRQAYGAIMEKSLQ